MALECKICSYYWGHRISHECNVLWAHHQGNLNQIKCLPTNSHLSLFIQAHHSSENYSLVNTFRLPFRYFYLFISKLVIKINNNVKNSQDWLYAFCYLPMALFISPAHYLGISILNKIVHKFYENPKDSYFSN